MNACRGCGVLIALHFEADGHLIGCARAREIAGEAIAADAKAGQRYPRVVQARKLQQDLPDSFTREQLADRLQISLTQFDAHRRRHDHPAIKELPRAGHPRFSVSVYLEWKAGVVGTAARGVFGRRRKAS